ncbi:uncharacterized protein C8R40DRAFT_1073484 [Lentinula edodes]|uniref:uncharacterized protein n=1 Tax=Lentinula edodes TaxID=5353 RepID=UPI001E8E3EDA|nr:uncharacterized protein C8R40DRAFT_1073484 [Lentinula edodes]KAH7870228.1 hypothetical protein C8R40DRAFT_1073484 [Lentinula edodes]
MSPAKDIKDSDIWYRLQWVSIGFGTFGREDQVEVMQGLKQMGVGRAVKLVCTSKVMSRGPVKRLRDRGKKSGSLQFEWFGEFPNTEEDVSYVQLPLPNGIEWKIRIFPSGRASMTSFGYFLQPVGDDGVPRVPNGFNVRLGSGGPPIDSWEQRFNKCCNITVPPINENEKWFFQEGQKVVVCHHQEVVGEVQIPIHPDRERQRDRRRNNGRPIQEDGGDKVPLMVKKKFMKKAESLNRDSNPGLLIIYDVDS